MVVRIFVGVPSGPTEPKTSWRGRMIRKPLLSVFITSEGHIHSGNSRPGLSRTLGYHPCRPRRCGLTDNLSLSRPYNHQARKAVEYNSIGTASFFRFQCCYLFSRIPFLLINRRAQSGVMGSAMRASSIHTS